MKTEKFRKKLTFKKQTIAQLGNEELKDIKGGTTVTEIYHCSGRHSCDYVSFCGSEVPCTDIIHC